MAACESSVHKTENERIQRNKHGYGIKMMANRIRVNVNRWVGIKKNRKEEAKKSWRPKHHDVHTEKWISNAKDILNIHLAECAF